MTAHKHAALMLQYAQDAAETDTPWKRWMVAAPGDKFVSLFGHPYWHEEYEYRRKPRTLTYTVTIPEPLREAPKIGECYYVMEPSAPNFRFAYWWSDNATDQRLLKRGLCFATEADAIAAAKALLPVKGE